MDSIRLKTNFTEREKERTRERERELVSWSFKPSQLQRIISGQKETFIKRYIFERTKKAEIRPEEQRVGKRRVVGIIYGMKYS